MAGQPKPAFFLTLIIVVIALIAFAARNYLFPKGESADQGAPVATDLDSKSPSESGDVAAPAEGGKAGAEAADAKGITTVSEYKFTPAQRLPAVKGTSAYKPMADNTVRFSLNVWAGWAPIILANDGFKAGKVWKTSDGKDFKVELALIDNPVTMRDAYAAGEVHIGWATLDMLPLLMDGLVDPSGKPKDSRVMPRVYQQVDWSNGGDGIVVRENIKSISDLRGKKIVLAQNSPSHYFALNMLVAGGVQPSETRMQFTDDAFQAAAAFNADTSISACVSWAPDIYNLEKVRGNRMLVTTATANKLIADVWFARADFAKDHPGIIEGLVRGIFDAMTDLKQQDKKKQAAELMAKGYNIPAPDALSMLNDAHNTNWGENYAFFVDQNNPANFERVWGNAYRLYRLIGAINHTPVPFDQVMDFSIIKKLGDEERYAAQKDEYRIQFTPKTVTEIQAEKPILTNTVYIHFYPNSYDIRKKITKKEGGNEVEELYDPNVDFVLDEIAKIVGQFGMARIAITGHTDGSMKGQTDPRLVKELSMNRANAVKEALVRKFPKLDPNQFSVDGKGWDAPADPNDPQNHAKNRRVEVQIFPAESQ